MNKTRSPRTIFLQLIRIFLLTASVLLLANLTVIQAQTNPAPACTKVKLPGPNLKAFVNSLAPGDVGCLSAGEHGARGTDAFMTVSGTPSAPITLRGYTNDARPTILGYFPIGGDNIVISGLLFDGPTGLVNANPPNPAVERSPIVIYGDNVEINRCEIRNSLSRAGIYLQDAYNTRLIGNYIHDNGDFGNVNTRYQDHGIYFASGSGLIANNLIERNYAWGVHLYPSASNVIVQQNTIVRNGQSGVTIDNCAPVGCAPQPTNNLVVNNIIAFNKVHAFQSSVRLTGATGNVIKNNLFWGNEAGDIPSDERLRRGLTFQNNIQADPRFDPRFIGAFQYRLQSGSPAIDAALSPYTQPDDYDFIPRPQGAASDIGAFEFTPTPPTPAPTPTPTPPLAGTYDAVSDFSTTSNPTGAWSYGYKATSSSAFTRYTGNGQPWAGIYSWSPYAGGACCLMVAKNTTGATTTYGGSITQPADMLNLHPGAAGEQSTVRWTAPEAGTYQIKGRFQGIDTSGTTTNVRILHKGAQVWSGNINVFGAQSAYDFPLSVVAGDTIDFAVDYGSNNTYYSDSTGLAATITPISISPTPTPTPTSTVSPTPTPTVSPTPTGSTYNAVSDFSTTSNPTGAWSYGYKATSTSAFTRYTGNGQPWAGIYTWSPNSGGGCCLMVAKNTTGTTTTYGGSITQPADMLNLHPGAGGEQSTVRWTAPSAGTYQVKGRFQGIDTGGTTTNVRILHKGVQVQSGGVNGYGSQAAYDFALTVAAGDTIDFVVGYGSNLTYNNDSTGLVATITPTTTQAVNNTLSFIHFDSIAQKIRFNSTMSKLTKLQVI